MGYVPPSLARVCVRLAIDMSLTARSKFGRNGHEGRVRRVTTAVGLLTRGYFPRELPPPFTTEQFAQLVATQRQALPAVPGRTWTRCVSHNLARPGSLRRPLKIPHPWHHLPLAEEIEQQWPALVTHFRRSQLSASRPMVRRTVLDRAVVPWLNLRVLSRLRARRFVGSRYFLKTDINQFYPSIYTHSIPWALHTKAVAKANINATPGDRIDRAFRNQQDGQTVGVPIGPDCSLVVAEIILAAVDAALAPRRLRGFRYVDDYEIGFATLAEAEGALTDLQGHLAEYELNLNPRKTKIVEGPPALDEPWVIELNRFPFRGTTPTAQINDAVAFFSRAFELTKEHPQHAIMRYALVTAQRWVFANQGWFTFQGLLFNATTTDPASLPVAIVVLERHVAAGRRVNGTAARTMIESTIARHAPLGHGSEVAWALWAAIQFGVGLSATSAAHVAAMQDDVVALLALDANGRGLFPANALDTANWVQLITTPNALNEEHWLLAYEANRKGWLACPAVATHQLFSVLEQNRISFYDPARRQVNFTGAAAAIPGGTLGPGYG
jgi:hypothetical protein